MENVCGGLGPQSVEPEFCNRTRDSTNAAGHFLPQKVRPMSLHRPHFFRRNCHGLVRLGPRAYCKVRVEQNVQTLVDEKE